MTSAEALSALALEVDDSETLAALAAAGSCRVLFHDATICVFFFLSFTAVVVSSAIEWRCYLLCLWCTSAG